LRVTAERPFAGPRTVEFVPGVVFDLSVVWRITDAMPLRQQPAMAEL
jgi:hypothetical protein